MFRNCGIEKEDGGVLDCIGIRRASICYLYLAFMMGFAVLISDWLMEWLWCVSVLLSLGVYPCGEGNKNLWEDSNVMKHNEQISRVTPRSYGHESHEPLFRVYEQANPAGSI